MLVQFDENWPRESALTQSFEAPSLPVVSIVHTRLATGPALQGRLSRFSAQSTEGQEGSMTATYLQH